MPLSVSEKLYLLLTFFFLNYIYNIIYKPFKSLNSSA